MWRRKNIRKHLKRQNAGNFWTFENVLNVHHLSVQNNVTFTYCITVCASCIVIITTLQIAEVEEPDSRYWLTLRLWITFWGMPPRTTQITWLPPGEVRYIGRMKRATAASCRFTRLLLLLLMVMMTTMMTRVSATSLLLILASFCSPASARAQQRSLYCSAASHTRMLDSIAYAVLCSVVALHIVLLFFSLWHLPLNKVARRCDLLLQMQQ